MNDQKSGKRTTPEQESSEKRSLIIPLVLSALIAVIAVQGWFMLDMKHEIAELGADNESKPEDLPGSAVTTAARSESGIEDQTVQAQSDQNLSTPPLSVSSEQKETQAQPQTGDSAGDTTDGPSGNTAITPQVAPRSPFDDPFFHPGFHPGFRHGLNNDRYDRDPYREIERMRREMDEIMRDAFKRHGLQQHPWRHPDFGPADPEYGPGDRPGDRYGYAPEHRPGHWPENTGNFHIEKKADRYLVRLRIPGADKKHIKVDIDDLTLTVSGEQQQYRDHTDQFGNTTFRQQMSSSFKHRLTLPGPVKPESMRTRFNRDILEIMVSRAD